MNEPKRTEVANGRITVKEVREWLASLPVEFDNADFEQVVGVYPTPTKRIVAYKLKDDGSLGVVVNGMGTHLPFDDTIEWEHLLS